MKYQVTLKSGDGTEAGWSVQYFKWENPDATDPIIHAIRNWTNRDGKFVANLDLTEGEYGLVCHLALSGRKVEITLDPEPRITQPRNQQWPLEVEVPATRSQITGTRYFQAGENQ